MTERIEAIGERVDRIAAAVVAVPGVAGLHAGTFGEVGTYLPGRRVPGIRLDADHAEVHVSIVFGAPVLSTAALIRQAVAALTAGPVDVTVEDVLPAPMQSIQARSVERR
ncbi:Asp23/Gls24 family envelope stress response protein [Rhodococcus sp. CH91]|uniref:Asp23/Gls24 family envelope stress response protein n=1 Tax=Rhodococcus sp. CH91 TaxID=2910256 RepID=UPI001F4A7385|nr:Asp23/Gls24 family envelope stress response protein [Rhodococcus sp. CH91]